MDEERRGFFGGSVIALILFLAAMSLVGCAASQGYHRHDESGGYPAQPGNGSAHVGYGSNSGVVVGTTTTPEASVGAISLAGERDARAELTRTQVYILKECYRRYGWRCNMYPNGGYYSRPGYTLRGIQVGETVSAERDAEAARREAEEARRRADAALKGARRAAQLSLETADTVEQHLGEVH